jgi:hypothetical protein
VTLALCVSAIMPSSPAIANCFSIPWRRSDV